MANPTDSALMLVVAIHFLASALTWWICGRTSPASLVQLVKRFVPVAELGGHGSLSERWSLVGWLRATHLESESAGH